MSYKTNLTHKKREQLKSQMDDFATFQWRGHDMWADYGCFIINESKGSLKFYNGPGYSNKYAKSQFSSSVNALIGIDFKQKTIPMKIGMYWFTIEEYQNFLNEIGPYVINYLTFGYEKNYGYLVKLSNITDSPRHVVGTNEDGDYVYYTEMDLTWELLGDNCVRSNLPYEYKRDPDESNTNQYTWVFDKERSDMEDSSFLDTPILFELPLSFLGDNATLNLQAIHEKIPQPIELFNVVLHNLTYQQHIELDGVDEEKQDIIWDEFFNTYQMLLRYDSETGLIYIQEGDNDTWHLLNFQTDNNNGEYILESASITKWKIPGTLSQPSLKSTEWKFKINTTNTDLNTLPQQVLNTAITTYARKSIV